MSCSGGILTSPRWVSDPVDVVSGARVEFSHDFSVAWPLPFQWWRYADSTKVHSRGELGRGHAHHLERWLQFTADGIRYHAPIGSVVDFPAILLDGGTAALGGLTLRRISLLSYAIEEPGRPTFEFRFSDPAARGLLRGLRSRDGGISIEHDAAGRVSVATAMGPGLGATPPSVRFVRSADGVLQRLDLIRPGEKDRTIAEFQYENGDLVRQTDPYKNAFAFQLDASGRCVRRTDPGGFSFHFTYDNAGRCVHAKGDGDLHEVTLRYMREQGVTHVTRGDGGLWQYFYTPDGTLTQVVDPYGGLKAYALAPDGRVDREIDAAGNASRVVYSAAGAPVGREDAFGRFTREGVEPSPRPHRVAETPAEYELGLLADIVAPHSALHVPRAASEFGPNFAPAPLAARPGEMLDAFGLLVQQRTDDGAARRWVYTPNAWVEKYTDLDGSTYSYGYTLWNMLARETAPSGASTLFRYTAERMPSAIIDPGGAASEYEYDLKDRLIGIKRHGVVKEKYRYDAADNLVQKTDSKGNVLLDIESGPGKLITRRRLGSGELQTFAYDDAGRMTLADGVAGATSFAYDAAGRCIADLREGQGVTHEYDSLGALRTTTVLGLTTSYVRRGNSERGSDGTVTIRDPAGGTHAIRFSEGLVQKDLAPGVREVVLFDAAGRVSRKTVELGDAVWTRRYTYSGEGDLLAAEDSRRGDIAYAYDADHRLIRATQPDGAMQTFSYDAPGNLIAQPGLAEVSLVQGNRIEAAGGERFEHDHRNNVSLRKGANGKTSYHRDSRGRLIRAVVAGDEWTALYDPIGRRVRKTWRGRTTTFYWDGDRLAAEVDPDGRLRLYVYADAIALTPILFLDYESLPAAMGGAKPKAYSIIANQIGAPVLVVDQRGSEAWNARISPYGAAKIAPGAAVELNLRFPGHYYDAELGLHYNRFRYYDPQLGRYLESDPEGIAGGINLYAYSTRPLVEVDTRGLCPARRGGSSKPKQDHDDNENTNPKVKAAIDDDEARSKVAAAAGMEAEDLKGLQQQAKDNQEVIIVRKTNPKSLPHHEREDCIPKPVDCKLKTDPDTGLVMNRGKNAGKEAPEGYHFDREGYLRRDHDGKYVYGDHDLQGAYRDESGNNKFNNQIDTNSDEYQDRVNEAMGGRKMVAHGANDNHVVDGEMGRQPGYNESFLVIEPDGTSHIVGPPTSKLQDYYDQHDIPWPYDNYRRRQRPDEDD